MKNQYVSFVLFLGMILAFTGCGSADAGEKTADQFFSYLIKGEYEKADQMIGRMPGDTTSYLPQMEVLGENPVNGKLKSAKKSMGFNTNVNNGITTVKLPYTLTYEKGTQNFEVIIVDRGDGYKISSVQ